MELQKNNAKYSIILYLSRHSHTYDVPYNTLCMACHISEHTIYITPLGHMPPWTSHPITSTILTHHTAPQSIAHITLPSTTDHITQPHNTPCHFQHIPTLTVTTHHTPHQPLPHQTYKHKLFKCCAFGTGSTKSKTKGNIGIQGYLILLLLHIRILT